MPLIANKLACVLRLTSLSCTIGLLSCGGSPAAPIVDLAAGRWTGTYADTSSKNSGTIVLQLFADGTSLVGNWTVAPTDPSKNNSGSLVGTPNDGSPRQLLLHCDKGDGSEIFTPIATVNFSVSGNVLTGTYQTAHCLGWSTGSLSLTK